MKIIAFPPVGYAATRWEEVGQIQTGQGFFNGERVASAFGPVRVSASVAVVAMARNRSGAGFMEMLKRQMRHGIDCVKFKSPPINWYIDHVRNRDLRTSPLAWTDDAAPLDWVDDASPLLWFDGAIFAGTPGTDAKGFDMITVAGLPPNRLIARPADVLRSYAAAGATATARALTEASSNGSGVAVIRLDGPLPAGTISIGDHEERVFAIDGAFPSVEQTVSGNWFYPLNLIEVLPAEYGDAEEVDPWT